MKGLFTVLLAALFALGLSACSNFKEDLGLGRSPPDEFAVVDRQPLSMPPDFGLRPPKPGASRPQEIDLTKRAEETLTANAAGTDTTNTASSGVAVAPKEDTQPSTVEKALLAQTNADKASPDIREVINRESSEKIDASEHLVQRLLWWKKDESGSPTVDAPAEAARIKEAQEKGEAVNAGATPIIERQESGFLGM